MPDAMLGMEGYAQDPSQPGKSFSIPVEREGVSLMGVSGNAILNRCTNQLDDDGEYCLDWMRLAADNAMSLKEIDPNLPLCIPQEVDAGQLRDVAIEHLRRRAKDRHMAASILVAEAFYNAWPCQTGKKGRGASSPIQSKRKGPSFDRRSKQ
jgi:hypothetical protein